MTGKLTEGVRGEAAPDTLTGSQADKLTPWKLATSPSPASARRGGFVVDGVSCLASPWEPIFFSGQRLCALGLRCSG